MQSYSLRPWTAFFVTASLGLSSVAYAGRASECLLSAFRVLPAPPLDSSVELELAADAKTIRLLTTPDGKVGSLLKKDETLPPWFVQWESQKHPGVKNLNDLDWDLVEGEIKLRLLTDVSAGRHQDFFADRKLYGITVRKNVRIKFKKATLFLGKHYDPGEYDVDISSVLTGKVEYRSERDVANASGVELHFRGNQTSGRMSNDAWTLLDGLGIWRNHQHVHIVARLPVEELAAEPQLEAARLGDFFRRANLAAEMVDIVQNNGRIATNETDTAVYFDSLSQDNLEGVTQYFLDVAAGKRPAIADDYKMGWIGMRGSDKYDQADLWGIEVRSVPSKSDPDTNRNLLDGLQYSMTSHEYGIPKEQMKKWLAASGHATSPAALREAWYNQDWAELLASPPKEARARLGGLWGWANKPKLQAAAKDNRELKMLVFDWSKDPLLSNQPALLQKIGAEQAKAIDRVLKGQAKINDVMSDFLIDSGLYDVVLKSVGVEVRHVRTGLAKP